jgi:hypothetical protein
MTEADEGSGDEARGDSTLEDGAGVLIGLAVALEIPTIAKARAQLSQAPGMLPPMGGSVLV